MDARDEGDVSIDGSAKLQRACDACRSRKIRCDRATPCSNCKASKLTCQTTAPAQKPQKQRVHISDEYERKIDRIEDRLAGIETVLEKLTTKLDHFNIRTDDVDQTRRSASVAAGKSPHSRGESHAATPAGFEGETTMNTQSRFARELLEKAVGSTPSISQNAEIKATLTSLQDMVNKQNVFLSGSTETSAFFDRKLSETEAAKHERPPRHVVDFVIERASSQPTMCLAIVFPFLKLNDVKPIVTEAYDTPADCSPSRRILIYGVLYNLFSEFAFCDLPGFNKDDFDTYVNQSKAQMEMAMSQLDLLLPATYENVVALLMAASHCVELAKPSLCWIMTSTAAGLATSLGYHRISSMKDDSAEERSAKIHVFWFIYTLDKMLSLRLGRASVIQDWDMSLPFVEPNEAGQAEGLPKGAEIHVYWIKVAQIQGRTYEQLFSPASFLKPQAERARVATELVNAMNEAWTVRGNASVADFVSRGCLDDPSPATSSGTPEGRPSVAPSEASSDHSKQIHFEAGSSHFLAFSGMFYHSDIVLHHSTTTLIQRAMSPDNVSFSEDCVESARAALRAHQACSRQYNHKGNEALWSGYVNWSVLQAPFTPFIVVFCSTITHCHQQDLYSLSEFVLSLETCRSISEGVDKLYRMCHLFLLVAKHYVEAKTREAEAHRSTADPVGFYGADGGQIDFSGINVNQFEPYLSALGLGPQPSWPMASYPDGPAGMPQAFEGGRGGSGPNTVQDWFSGSRYIMGLMEGDDISMPDFTAPTGM